VLQTAAKGYKEAGDVAGFGEFAPIANRHDFYETVIVLGHI
jgi:hypothetical protein